MQHSKFFRVSLSLEGVSGCLLQSTICTTQKIPMHYFAHLFSCITSMILYTCFGVCKGELKQLVDDPLLYTFTLSLVSLNNLVGFISLVLTIYC